MIQVHTQGGFLDEAADHKATDAYMTGKGTRIVNAAEWACSWRSSCDQLMDGSKQRLIKLLMAPSRVCLQKA